MIKQIIILDSDFIYALFFQGQSAHINAAQIVTSHFTDSNLILTNHVKFEVLTLLSRRETQQQAISTISNLESLPNLRYYRLSKEDDEEVWKLFKTFERKNISMIDCANLYLATKNNYRIASFDQFYPSTILLK